MSVDHLSMSDDEEQLIIRPQETPGAVVRGSGRPLPTWFVVGLAAAVVWCASAGSIGVFLLIKGWYSPAVVGGVATLAALAVAIAVARGLGRREHADHFAAIVAVGLVLVFFVWAGAFHSEHLLSDRDPALYITNGRVIARTHELRPKTHVGAYQAREFGNPNGTYMPNFFPMLPVLLAVGWSIGGDVGLLLVGPFLGALGLCACYALASRVLRPRAALIVPAFLMLLPIQLWFARDAYSELVVQVVVLGGLWLYLEARARRRWVIGLISGCLVASSALARIDALTILVGALVVVAAEWAVCASDAAPARARRVVLAFGAGLVGATLITFKMTNIVAAAYIHSLRAEYHQLVAAFCAAIVGVIVVIVVQRARPGLGRRFVRSKSLFAAGVAAAAALAAWAYVYRPDPKRDLPIFTSSRQVTVHLRSVWVNWHYSYSMHWFSAYMGVTGVVVAFVGLVILAARARRGDSAAIAIFFVVVPVAVLYIARPSITPDQPWVMRRFLPIVIPGLAIAVGVAIVTAWRAAWSMRRSLLRAAAVSGVVAAVIAVAIPTAQAAIPFVHGRTQHGALGVVHDICRVTGDDSAVMVYGPGFIHIELPMPVWAFCGVPTDASGTVDLSQLARQWHAFGKRLVVATAVPDLVRRNAKGAKVVGHFVISDDDEPERVFEHAPRRFAPRPLEVWLLEVPPGPG